ncbi:MAG: Holliday junction resolvase RuvX [Gammaproteobacteria bacterium]
MQTNQALLGFDFGKKRIGVATGQTITQSANPLITLSAKQGAPDWEAIETLIQEWQPNALVVGIPYHMDGSEQPMTLAAERFCRQLEGRFNLPVHRADERLSSVQAESLLKEQGDSSSKIDAVAAQIILESWLQQKGTR